MNSIFSNLDSKAIDVSFVIPVKDDYRVFECIRKIKKYVESKSISAEILVCGRLDYQMIPQDVRFIEVDPPDKGRCIRTGAQASSGNIIVLIDADLPIPLTDVNKLISSVKSVDVAFGNRYLPLSSRPFNESLIRLFLSRIFRILVQIFFQLRGFDTQCGVKALRQSVKEKLFRHQITYGFAYDVELSLRVKQLNLSFEQIPVHLNNSLNSTINLWQNVVSVLKEILVLFYCFRLKRMQRIFKY